MTRVLLRLLLMVSLAMNGVGAPWAMAKSTSDTAGHDHAAMMAHAPAEQTPASSDCHHGAHHGSHDGMGHRDAGAPAEPADRSCCDGPDCSCGCMLPPVLARFVANLPVLAFTAAPVAEPATRAGVRRTIPLLRPPAS